MKVLARKKQFISLDDTLSTGWAARGHIMEPYAIQEFNKVKPGLIPHIHHWDDKLIQNDWLGYSPDGLDYTEVPGVFCSYTDVRPTVLAEVKCYAADNHYSKGNANKFALEERWQIATAMAVSPSIEEAYLIFFNPSCKDPMFVQQYSREQLKEEIKTIGEVEEPWREFLCKWRSSTLAIQPFASYTRNDIPITEEFIYEIHCREKELNP